MTLRSAKDRQQLQHVARGGICGACHYAALIKSSKGSLFLLCQHPDLPKYQGQPVRCCAHYQHNDYKHDQYQHDKDSDT